MAYNLYATLQASSYSDALNKINTVRGISTATVQTINLAVNTSSGFDLAFGLSCSSVANATATINTLETDFPSSFISLAVTG